MTEDPAQRRQLDGVMLALRAQARRGKGAQTMLWERIRDWERQALQDPFARELLKANAAADRELVRHLKRHGKLAPDQLHDLVEGVVMAVTLAGALDPPSSASRAVDPRPRESPPQARPPQTTPNLPETESSPSSPTTPNLPKTESWLAARSA